MKAQLQWLIAILAAPSLLGSFTVTIISSIPMPTQLIAGSISDVLKGTLVERLKERSALAVFQLLESLCHFETDLLPQRIQLPDDSEARSLLSIYHNYLRRGIPCKTTVGVESYLTRTWGGISDKHDDTGGYGFEIDDPSETLIKQLFAALFIVDPRITDECMQNSYWQRFLGSELERRFVKEIFLPGKGVHWLQVLEAQRELVNILEYNYKSGKAVKEVLAQPYESFTEQRVDFSIEMPCAFSGDDARLGLVIEIDGSQHIGDRAQYNLDQRRDYVIEQLSLVNWATMRLPSGQWKQGQTILRGFDEFFTDRYFVKVKENYEAPIYAQDGGLRALNLALTPMAVSRIQAVLIELIFNGALKFGVSEWRIGIIERDVDCARIAIEDFKDFLHRLCGLSGIELTLPEISLHIYDTPEFRCAVIDHKKLPIEEAAAFQGDVLIDISILQRWGLTEHAGKGSSAYKAIIRSAHSAKVVRTFLSAKPIKYPALEEEDPDSSEKRPLDRVEHLCYFIRSAFRKADLRPGQLPIIAKALNLQSVIGLLPTGGGKSLTYQICSLLQPGTTLIVDPIKSLMQDQFDGLKRNTIDAAVFVNSNVKTQFERDWRLNQIRDGHVLFAFISPERMQMEKFRTNLSAMGEGGHFVTYCVIDEAHCVSEWGHDFRTSYLRLGENVRRFCSAWNQNATVPLFGLTATASFDVLADIKRELQIEGDGVVSRLGTERKELRFQVHRVQTQAGNSDYQTRQAIGAAKVERILSILKGLPHDIEVSSEDADLPKSYDRESFYKPDGVGKTYQHSILVFCAHTSARSPFGVEYVAPRISSDQLSVKTYHGKNPNGSDRNQNDFVSDKVNALVATKAFGMGIDKPNIRATVHFNFPSSIEAFIQESGRAGRDRKRAFCHVLLSNHGEVEEDVVRSFHENNFKGVDHDYGMINELLTEIHYSSQRRFSILTSSILDDLGEVVQVSMWPAGNPYRVYLNRAYQMSYGYIALPNLTIDTTHTAAEIGQDIATVVLDYAAEWIRQHCDNGNVVEWLQEIVFNNSLSGIEDQLEGLIPGQSLPAFEIGFTNDRALRLSQILSEHAGTTISETIIWDSVSYTRTFDGFGNNLSRKCRTLLGLKNIDLQGLGSDIEKLCRQFYHELRSEIDTLKAIYRLSIIGIIDDYEVNYAKSSLAIKTTKKSDEEYVGNLRTYLGRYQSPKRVSEWMARLSKAGKGSTIRDCCYTLLQYTYDSIARKRDRAIINMRELCEQNSGVDKHEAIAKAIYVYFNSRFTEDILKLTNEGQEFSLELVSNYFELTAGNVDDLEHLRGSCQRILTDNPTNGALLLLNAYSNLLLETRIKKGVLLLSNQYLIDKAVEDLDAGLEAFGRDHDQKMPALNLFRRDIISHNHLLEPLLDDVTALTSLRSHTNWLSKFTTKFLDR